jgi:Catalase (peroxidase I)
MSTEMNCPFHNTAAAGEVQSNRDWWPERLNVGLLRQNSSLSDPLDADFDYVKASRSWTSMR